MILILIETGLYLTSMIILQTKESWYIFKPPQGSADTVQNLKVRIGNGSSNTIYTHTYD